MTHYIENDYLRVGVKEYGCELTSVYSKECSYEYLWQGDESVWYGQSPILFPIVGRLIEDKYMYNGKEYSMPKHGFARKTEWKLDTISENKMSFVLSDSEETLKIYPFHFEVSVTFEIINKSLSVTHEVKNTDTKDMFFSLGAHPGFNCSIGDILTFDENETLSTEKIDLIHSLRLPDTYPVLNNEKNIIITEHIFDEDALILSNIKSSAITLNLLKENKTVKFNLGNAPYLGIWAKPGAPYVCIEPWYGVNDSTIKKNDISEKDAINKLNANAVFSFTWNAEFSD